MNTFCPDTSVRRLTTKLEFSLLAVGGSLSTSCGALVTGVTRNTHPTQIISVTVQQIERFEASREDVERVPGITTVVVRMRG